MCWIDVRAAQTPAGVWEGHLPVPTVSTGEGNPAVVSLYGREAVEDLEVQRAAGSEIDAPPITSRRVHSNRSREATR